MPPLDQATIDQVHIEAPEWLRQRRLDAFGVFTELELPSESDDLWRYVDLGVDLGDFALPGAKGSGTPVRSGLADALTDLAGRAVVTDGVVTEASSGTIEVVGLGDAIASAPQRIESIYGSAVPVGSDIFTAAHQAFGRDAVVVRAPRGSAGGAPVHILVGAVAADTATFPHVLVDVEDGAEVSVIVEYTSHDELVALVAPQIEVFTGTNATLRLTIIQRWGSRTTALATGHVVVGRDATVHLAEAGLGGALARFHLTVDLVGRGSSAVVLGAYFGDEDQTLDYRYVMHHVGLNTTSDMFLKGAVEDDALSVFTGMIRIEENAQRTNAFQTNRNLILSSGAAAQSVPNLEILANDVRCGHGSTIGPLDDEQRYYLMSRGLDGSRADRLQVRGFFEQVLERFPTRAVAAPVRGWINDKYVNAQEAGRV